MIAEVDLEDLHLTTHTANALRRVGIRSLDDLLSLSMPLGTRSLYNVFFLRGVGLISLLDLVRALRTHLGQDIVSFEHERGNDRLFEHLELHVQAALLRECLGISQNQRSGRRRGSVGRSKMRLSKP